MSLWPDAWSDTDDPDLDPKGLLFIGGVIATFGPIVVAPAIASHGLTADVAGVAIMAAGIAMIRYSLRARPRTE